MLDFLAGNLSGRLDAAGEHREVLRGIVVGRLQPQSIIDKANAIAAQYGISLKSTEYIVETRYESHNEDFSYTEKLVFAPSIISVWLSPAKSFPVSALANLSDFPRLKELEITGIDLQSASAAFGTHRLKTLKYNACCHFSPQVLLKNAPNLKFLQYLNKKCKICLKHLYNTNVLCYKHTQE